MLVERVAFSWQDSMKRRYHKALRHISSHDVCAKPSIHYSDKMGPASIYIQGNTYVLMNIVT